MSAIVSFDIDIKSILNNELSHFQTLDFDRITLTPLFLSL